MILAGALPLAVVMTYFWWQSLQDGRTRELALLQANVQQIEHDLHDLWRESEWVLSRMAARPDFRGLTPEACSDEMAMIREVNPAFRIITLWKSDGRLVCSSAPLRPEQPVPLPHQPTFDDGMSVDGLHLSNLFSGPITGRPIVTFTYPVKNEAGTRIGLLGIVVEVGYFEKLVHRLQGRPGGAISIIDRNLNFVVRVPDNRSWQGKSAAGLAGVAIAFKSAEGTFSNTGIDGVPRIVAHKTVRNAGWKVFVGVAEEVLFASYRLQLLRGVAVFSIVVALSLALAYLLGRGITRPLQGLVAVADAVEQGDHTARATPSGGDEIARLAEHLNRMLDALMRSEGSLREREARLRAIFETEPECVTVLGDDGLVREKNAAGLAVLDADSLDQLRGRPLIELVAPEYRASFERLFRRVMDGGSGVLEYELETLKGRRLLLETHAAPLRDAAGNVTDMLGITLDVTKRKSAERTLQLSMARARELSARLLHAGESERKRLAHDLHDQVGQELTALKIRIEMLAAASPQMRPQLAGIAAAAGDTLQRVRQMSVDLRPPQLDTLGLEAALRAHVERQGAIGKIALHYNSRGLPRGIPADIEIVCFRVVQEALTNAMRHSGAANAWVDLGCVDGVLTVEVRDDGDGFDAEQVLEVGGVGSGFGLPGMQERVVLAGGVLDISSQTGQGCAVTASFAIAGMAGWT